MVLFLCVRARLASDLIETVAHVSDLGVVQRAQRVQCIVPTLSATIIPH
jgi:hypothetical protein